MISNPNTVFENLQKQQNEINKKSNKNAQSTDTEPEAEAENTRNKKQKVSNNEPINEQSQTKKARNGFHHLLRKLPTYEYEFQKCRKNDKQNHSKNDSEKLITMNTRDTDNNRFTSHNEAFLHVAHHCQQNHCKFTRELCSEYLKGCYVIDFANDGFLPAMAGLTKKEFNKCFMFAQKELKYM